MSDSVDRLEDCTGYWGERPKPRRREETAANAEIPNSHELFLLDPGEKKVTWEADSRTYTP